MTVEKEVREFWNTHRERGDVTAIAEKTGRDRAYLSQIINGHIEEAPAELVKEVTEFYKKRVDDKKAANDIK